LLVDETLQEMSAALQRLHPQQIHLRTRTLAPTIRDSDIAPIASQLHTLLAEPVVLSTDAAQCQPECRWEWPREKIASWIDIYRNLTPEGRPDIRVSIDQAALQRELVPIASTLQLSGALPRVAWNGGDMQIIQEGTTGIGLNASLTLSLVNTALWGGRSREIALPITEIPPPVTASNLNSLGIVEQVGAGVSSFRASQPYRITNIQAGAQRMSGILIAPGETFSFNTHLGPVDGNTAGMGRWIVSGIYHNVPRGVLGRVAHCRAERAYIPHSLV
jgi:vancomycin resistance protein YoaR